MIFTDLNETNYSAVARIDALSLGEDGWSENLYKAEINDQNKCYVVALQDVDADAGAKSIVVGFGGFMQVMEEGDILNIAVHPDYRRQGIGKAILDELLERGKRMGVKAFTLEVRESNQNARRLYEKKGFRFVGVRKGYYHGEDACIYWLYL